MPHFMLFKTIGIDLFFRFENYRLVRELHIFKQISLGAPCFNDLH